MYRYWGRRRGGINSVLLLYEYWVNGGDVMDGGDAVSDSDVVDGGDVVNDSDVGNDGLT
jgi:hypothetical protein